MSFLQILEEGDAEKIERALSSRLSKNIALFQSLNPELYRLLTLPPKEYQLYLGKEGINIVNIRDNSFVYPKVAGRHTFLDVSKNIAMHPYTNRLWNLKNNGAVLVHYDTEKLPETAGIINTLVDTIPTASTISFEEDFLPTCTVFGLGGGLFIEYLLESVKRINSLLIYEEHYDFFRISCALVDYERLFEVVSPKSCHIYVQNILDPKSVKDFFEKHKLTSNALRMELMTYKSDKNIEAMHIVDLEHASNIRGWGSFEDEKRGVANSMHNTSIIDAKTKYPILSNPKKLGMPICVVGNGYSLNELLPFIKANSDKMLIFSSGTALKPLKAAGIRPDFQIEIERFDDLHRYLAQADPSDTTLLCGNIVNEKALALGKEVLLFMRGSSAHSYDRAPKKVVDFSFPLVGNAAFSLATLFSDEIYICGLDMAYKKGKKKHADGSIYTDEKDEIPKGAIRCEGNFGDELYTDSIFALSREIIEFCILIHKPKNVYNLSDGVRIRGAKATKPNEIKLRKMEKKKYLKEIRSAFSSNPQTVFGGDSEDFIGQFEILQKRLFETLQREINSKDALFEVIDDAYAVLQKFKREHLYSGIFIGGSFMHVLNTIFLLALHSDSANISEIYAKCVDTSKKLVSIYPEIYKNVIKT